MEKKNDDESKTTKEKQLDVVRKEVIYILDISESI